MSQKPSIAFHLRRIEKQVLVRWIRFSRDHRDSHKLPIVLFILLFLDGFLMVIPSTVCLIAAVTISPARWRLFAILFASAATLNNFVTYWIGYFLPVQTIQSTIDFFHLEVFWTSAQEALSSYGPFATFIGAIIGLPTQMITALMGISDKQILLENPLTPLTLIRAILFALAGHSVKAFGISALARYGWLKLEKKFG